MIRVEDNCNPPKQLYEFNRGEIIGKLPSFEKRKDEVGRGLHLNIGNFLDENPNRLLSFYNDEGKYRAKNNDDELVVAVSHEGEHRTPSIQTGNYLGRFQYDGLNFNIQSRFGEPFLKRMLNFANDIYLDDVDAFSIKTEDVDYSRLILYYLFVQSLEKAYLLGLPRIYRNVQHHDMCLKGRIDINHYIQRDIPFVGKISSVSRELGEVQEIVDVLHKAVSVITKRADPALTKNIAHIKPHLREVNSGKYVSAHAIAKAKASKALLNPIFSPYKKTLLYAEYIILLDSLQEATSKSNEQYPNFLVNVAELFEIYVTKLLQRSFPEWSVSSPKLELYDEMFFSRKIIPDIVMQYENRVMVFDTKYKRMAYQKNNDFGMGDLDRGDFFQINTYMSYYQQKGMKLLCGGLLYPLSDRHKKEKCHSLNWLGNSDVKFIVDGIEVKNKSIDGILYEEKRFIERIESILVDH